MPTEEELNDELINAIDGQLRGDPAQLPEIPDHPPGELAEDLWLIYYREVSERLKDVEAERDSYKDKLNTVVGELLTESGTRKLGLERLNDDVKKLRHETALMSKQRDVCEAALRQLHAATELVPDGDMRSGDYEVWHKACDEAGELLKVIDKLKKKR